MARGADKGCNADTWQDSKPPRSSDILSIQGIAAGSGGFLWKAKLRDLGFAVVMLLATTGQLAAADALWLDMGESIQTQGGIGYSVGGNWMPGEWGLSLRNTDSFDVGQFIECLLGLSCNDSIVMNEVAILAQREYDDGGVIAGAGISRLSYLYASPAEEKVVYGMPLEVRVRTRKWSALGLSLALRGNINEVENFVGLSLLLEVGARYR